MSKTKKKKEDIYGLYYAASNTVYISHTQRAEQRSIHSTAGTGGTSTAINHSIMLRICYYPPSFIQGFFLGGNRHFHLTHRVMQLTLMGLDVTSGVTFPPFCGVNVHDSMGYAIVFAAT